MSDIDGAQEPTKLKLQSTPSFIAYHEVRQILNDEPSDEHFGSLKYIREDMITGFEILHDFNTGHILRVQTVSHSPVWADAMIWVSEMTMEQLVGFQA